MSDQDTIRPPISPPAVSAGNHKPIQSSSDGGTTGDAPSCSTCGMLMMPNGSCYKCVNSGSTSGCS